MIDIIDTAKTVSLYGFLLPKKGLKNVLRSELLTLAELSRTEEGNLIYNIHEETYGAFFLYELWRSKEDLEKHWKQPYLKKSMDKINDFLEEEIIPHSGTLII